MSFRLSPSRNSTEIDHNFTFDETAIADFLTQHIFASSRAAWSETFRQSTMQTMQAALNDLDTWWRVMPTDWTEVDTGLTLESVKILLWRFQTDPVRFWGTA